MVNAVRFICQAASAVPCKQVLAAIWITALVAEFGCERMPETIPVRGRVTYHGQPLATGDVKLIPVEIPEGRPKRPATGSLNVHGEFELSTFRPGDGVVPGEYAVAVVSIRRYANLLDPNDKPEYAVPRRYVDPNTSGLKAVIPEQTSEPIELDFKLVE